MFKCPNEQEIEGAQMKCIVLGLLALLISACNGSRTEQLLLNQVQALVRSAQETDKVLKLNQINGLEWDEMLVIRPYTSFNSLDEELALTLMTSNPKQVSGNNNSLDIMLHDLLQNIRLACSSMTRYQTCSTTT